MAFINPDNDDVIVVDAKLTKRGRQLLSSGIQNFKITKFAISDDQIDYNFQGLQNNSQLYPIFQPITKGNLFLRNKLYTLPAGSAYGKGILPTIIITGMTAQGTTNYFSGIGGAQLSLAPQTTGYTNKTENYIFTVNVSSANTISKIIAKSSGESQEQITNVQQVNTLSGYEQIVLFKNSVVSSQTVISVNIQGMTSGAYQTFYFTVTPATEVNTSNTSTTV